jgi:lipopolysaccharide biosynthesis protein
MRLALYAHFSESNTVARHVLYCLQKLSELGFQVHFISNSPIASTSTVQLEKICDRVIQRENTGLDFAMWQRGLAECDWSKAEELLLTNSSIIGPLQPLAPLWENPAVKACDFWGLTDNDEIRRHLQSFFLVFNKKVIRSDAFSQFWKSVLPYRDKDQVIRCYEVGLTIWLEENGFKWTALYPQGKVFESYLAKRKKRSFSTKVLDRLHNKGVPAKIPGRNTTLFFPDFLMASGMPFLKKSLLERSYERVQPEQTFKWLQTSEMPKDVLEELKPRATHKPS